MEVVYLIRAIGVGKIKVGTTIDMGRRFADLSAMSPVPLEVVRTTDGSYAAEAELHQSAWRHHSHNEWFDEAALPRLLADIDRMEGAAKQIAELLAEHIPGEQWATLKANLYTAGAKGIAKEFGRLTGVSVFDNTRAGSAR